MLIDLVVYFELKMAGLMPIISSYRLFRLAVIFVNKKPIRDVNT